MIFVVSSAIPLGNSPWLGVLFFILVLAFLAAWLVGVLGQVSTFAAVLKLLFGARQAAAGTPSAAPSVLDGILQLQSLGTLRTTSTFRLSLGGSLLGSDFLQQATLVCAAVQVARSRKNFSLVRPYLSTRVFQRFSAEPAPPPLPDFHPFTVGTPSIVSHQTSGPHEIQVVRFAPTGGAADDWTFVRGRTEAPIAVECPRCGAPQGGINGTCRYCGAAVASPPSVPTGENAMGGWILDDVQPAGSVAA